MLASFSSTLSWSSSRFVPRACNKSNQLRILQKTELAVGRPRMRHVHGGSEGASVAAQRQSNRATHAGLDHPALAAIHRVWVSTTLAQSAILHAPKAPGDCNDPRNAGRADTTNLRNRRTRANLTSVRAEGSCSAARTGTSVRRWPPSSQGRATTMRRRGCISVP